MEVLLRYGRLFMMFAILPVYGAFNNSTISCPDVVCSIPSQLSQWTRFFGWLDTRNLPPYTSDSESLLDGGGLPMGDAANVAYYAPPTTSTLMATIVTVVNTVYNITQVTTNLPSQLSIQFNSQGTRVQTITLASQSGTGFIASITVLTYPTNLLQLADHYTWRGIMSVPGSGCLTGTYTVPIPSMTTWVPANSSPDPRGLDHILVNDANDNCWIYNLFSSLYPNQPALTTCRNDCPGPEWGAFTQISWMIATSTSTVFTGSQSAEMSSSPSSPAPTAEEPTTPSQNSVASAPASSLPSSNLISLTVAPLSSQVFQIFPSKTSVPKQNSAVSTANVGSQPAETSIQSANPPRISITSTLSTNSIAAAIASIIGIPLPTSPVATLAAESGQVSNIHSKDSYISLLPGSLGVVVDDQTLTPGGKITVASHTLSLAYGSSDIIVDDSILQPLNNVAISPIVVTVGSQTLTIVSLPTGTGALMAGQTLLPGEMTTIAGQRFSLGPEGDIVIVDGQTVSVGVGNTEITTASSSSKPLPTPTASMIGSGDPNIQASRSCGRTFGQMSLRVTVAGLWLLAAAIAT